MIVFKTWRELGYKPGSEDIKGDDGVSRSKIPGVSAVSKQS